MTEILHLACQGEVHPVEVEREGRKLLLRGPFGLKEEFKCMRGSRWDKEARAWSVSDCRRNWMQLESLQVENGKYKVPLELKKYYAPRQVFVTRHELMPHQDSMFQSAMNVRREEWAAEQGVGKTKAAIAVMEAAAALGFTDWWYVAPLAVLDAVKRELKKWGCKIQPLMLNYDILDREMQDRYTCKSCGEADVPEARTWTKAKVLKHDTSHDHLFEDGKCICGWFDGQREEPYPRCQACGTKSEGHGHLWRKQLPFKAPHGVIFDESSRLKNGAALRTEAAQKLADRVREEHDGFVLNLTGTPAPLDPGDWHSQIEILCPGFLRESTRAHLERRLAIYERTDLGDGRVFDKVVSWKQDEVERLYRRLKPIVEVHLAKNCLTLPELYKEVIDLPPSEETLRAARLIAERSANGAQALQRLRQLSDGFQYGESHTCSDCEGMGFLPALPDQECHACGGAGIVFEKDGLRRVSGPKEDRLRTDLALNEEIGRIVIYAGYQASVDQCVNVCQEEGWEVLKCDGRGWVWFGKYDKARLLDEMDLGTRTELDKVALVGHPRSVGLGQNLTAARENIFFSNDFDAEARMQAEKRSHRKGQTRAVTLKDYSHLPTDKFVIRNLENKRTMQSVTLGEVIACL